uniref:Uncharacterized protein n=1 Tax=Panagrolaimus sp. PS1159 TaxID=55785 RepID=A0AC35ES62_9BILA
MKSSAKALIASSHNSTAENNTSFASLPKSLNGNNTSGKIILNSSNNDLRYCEACENQPIFSSFQEFAFHLRTQHCSKEGGSFVCRYGLNGVCQMLPVEGVSDEDYEKHIRKCHLKKSNSNSTTMLPENDIIDAVISKQNTLQRTISQASTIASSSNQKEPFTVNR